MPWILTSGFELRCLKGYHDIVSVIFLTLPEEMQLLCAEKISLHRVRDSMGSTLEPILGLLRYAESSWADDKID